MKLLDQAVLQKGLPSSVDTERALLGTLLMARRLLPGAADLGPDVFTVEKHRLVFNAIRARADLGEPIEEIGVADALKVRGELESAGGLAAYAT